MASGIEQISGGEKVPAGVSTADPKPMSTKSGGPIDVTDGKLDSGSSVGSVDSNVGNFEDMPARKGSPIVSPVD